MKNMFGVMVAGLIAMSGAAIAGQQDFMLENQTGVEIAQIHISAASVDSWQENLLAEDEVLPSGNEVEINFAPEEEAELWDIRIADSEGTSITWERLKLTEIVRVTLKIKDGEPVAEIENAEAEEEAAE